MKTLKYFSLFIAAGLFAACSDNLNEGNGDNNDGPKTGEGYVKVAINMPTVSGSRADESFDDGSENEYAVKTGIIAFFEGESESTATFVKAYNLGNLSNSQKDDTTPNNQISTVVTQIIEAPLKKDSEHKMYALVILNNGIVASVGENGVLTLENGDTDITLSSISSSTSSSTIAALNGGASESTVVKWALNVSDITGDNGFLMLNAPLYKSETQHKTQTLVPVNVYERKDQADVATADKIYVERIVAKVDVKLNEEKDGTAGTLTVTDGIFKDDKVIFYEKDNSELGWVLNVTNKTTKPLRDVSEISKWIEYNNSSADWVGSGNSLNGWNRTYWAKDNNYTSDEPEIKVPVDDFTTYSSTTQPTSWGGYTTTSGPTDAVVPQYCLENTVPGSSYWEKNTTAILIKAKYDIAGDGTTNDDENDDSFFIMDKVATTMTEKEFTDKIAEILKGSSNDTYTVTIKKQETGGKFSGATELAQLLEVNNGDYEITVDNAAAIGEVRYYKDGVCYYFTIPIQHFSSITKLEDGVTDANYTGKYGVVRNNWYQITINSVKGPGEPEIPDPEGPVDKEEGYIKAEINVLSWAKRTQGVDL